jgi:tetratricopeptide (TPR) repeat protein
LLPRFLKGDSSLSQEQVLALQIAFTANKKYWPYTYLKKEREIWLLNDEGKHEEALKYCDTILNSNPFNLLANREKSYALQKLNRDSFEIFFKRFEMLVNTNLSTGTGFSIDSSWFVLCPADGQLLITTVFAARVCYMGSENDSNGYFHDVLGMKINDVDYCAKLYFNIHHAANRMFSEADKKKMKKLLKAESKESKKIKKGIPK